MMDIHQRTVEAAHNVREFRGTTPSLAFIELFDALDATYTQQLRDCKPEELDGLQRSLRQLDSLRAVARGENTTDGTI